MTNTNGRTLLWRGALLSAAALIAWKIITINLSDHYVDVALARASDPAAIESALFWDDAHPKALTMKARQLVAMGRDDEAEPLLVAAIEGNPADARPLVLLAEIRSRNGEVQVADQMVKTADALMPVHEKVQRSIAGYWAARGRLDLAVLHLATALSANPEGRSDDYPILLRIAEDEAARQTLAPLAAEPPAWWGGFFHHAARNAENMDTVRALMSMREASNSAAISEPERSAYIERLRKEGLISEAYLHWVNGLDADSLKFLGYLFDGGFEREISNAGFGWHTRSEPENGIYVNTSTTYGIEGRQALNVRLGGKRVRFNHVYQRLFLPLGNYRFSGRGRPDKLKARKGIQWVVYCTVGTNRELGQSNAFLGGGDWRSFEFAIQVPPDCGGQLLRLQSVGNREVDHELEGSIWFDDLRIELQREASVTP